MLDSYLRYCLEPSVYHAADLWHDLSRSGPGDWDWDRLFEARRKARFVDKDVRKLHSAGSSSGNTRTYRFGPLAGFWLEKVETFSKNPDRRRVVVVQRSIGTAQEKPATINFHGIDHVVNNSLNAAQLLDVLDGLGPNLVVLSTPFFFLSMLRDDDFCETVRRRDYQLVSTGTTRFFPSSVFVNDNMIDWTTGQNFYTCRSGTKHFLPLFIPANGDVLPLLNFRSGPMPSTDLFEFGNKPERCTCGKDYLALDFVSLKQFAIKRDDGSLLDDCSLADDLADRYESFQLVQTIDGTVDVLYLRNDRHAMSDQDVKTTRDFLDRHRLRPRMMLRNHYLLTSQGVDKAHCYYRNDADRPYSKTASPRMM